MEEGHLYKCRRRRLIYCHRHGGGLWTGQLGEEREQDVYGLWMGFAGRVLRTSWPEDSAVARIEGWTGEDVHGIEVIATQVCNRSK